MKNKKLSTISIIIIWVVTIALVPIVSKFIEERNMKNNFSYISSDFDIKEYSVILDVDKNNKIDVTENITINIPENEEYKGIYKSIPLWIKYYDDNEKEYKSKVKISNLRVIGEQFEVSSYIDKVGIKIGSRKVNAEAGLHTYTIKYRYDFGTSVNNELVYNIFSNYKNSKIKSMNININMPEDAKDYKIKFLNRSEDLDRNVIYTIYKNEIKASINDYLLDDSLTLKITFPNGYLVGGSSNYGIICMMICIAIIIISLVVFVLWLKHGKDYAKKVSTIEFYPPDDLDASEIGYIFGEKSIKKLTTALIIQLASKEYIKIEEIGKNKYKIIDIGKDKDGLKSLSINEQIVYVELFKNSSENIISEDRSFSLVFEKISKSLGTIFKSKVKDNKSNRMMKYTFLMLIVSIILWSISYVYIKDLNPRFDILYALSFISVLVTGAFSIIMDRKTEYGEMIIAKVKGFREYLTLAEKDSIELMVEKNPKYFYDILPYTYVMGISDKWIKLFEIKNIPNIDLEILDNYENGLFIIV